MSSHPRIRRQLVLVGVIVSLVLAGTAVRAASLWTAQSAPLAQPPSSIQSIESALSSEQARSAALQGQLDALRTSSQDLVTALATANDRVTIDQATADTLRTSLAAAQKKLASLEAALKAAATPSGPGAGTRMSSTGSETGVEVGDD